MDLSKYPRAEKFLKETGMTLDQALAYFEKLEQEERFVKI